MSTNNIKKGRKNLHRKLRWQSKDDEINWTETNRIRIGITGFNSSRADQDPYNRHSEKLRVPLACLPQQGFSSQLTGRTSWKHSPEELRFLKWALNSPARPKVVAIIPPHTPPLQKGARFNSSSNPTWYLESEGPSSPHRGGSANPPPAPKGGTGSPRFGGRPCRKPREKGEKSRGWQSPAHPGERGAVDPRSAAGTPARRPPSPPPAPSRHPAPPLPRGGFGLQSPAEPGAALPCPGRRSPHGGGPEQGQTGCATPRPPPAPGGGRSRRRLPWAWASPFSGPFWVRLRPRYSPPAAATHRRLPSSRSAALPAPQRARSWLAPLRPSPNSRSVALPLLSGGHFLLHCYQGTGARKRPPTNGSEGARASAHALPLPPGWLLGGSAAQREERGGPRG